MTPKVIAFYLPQFHPMPENDKWWGKGFTEWTNVAKAKPLFRGHKQPHLPADLGFYDLRLPDSRIAQADMAREFGVSAFCYWHYWFNGKKLLNFPFEEVVRTKQPDFPFCLAWANHSWYNKQWTSSGSGFVSLAKTTLLIEQTYGGVQDYTNHFMDLLSAFKDNRYFKIHEKLLFVIFDPDFFPDFPLFKDTWNSLAEQNGLPGFYFVAHVFKETTNIDKYKDMGYDAVNLSLHAKPFGITFKTSGLMARIKSHFTTGPLVVDYKKAISAMDSPMFEQEDVFPTIIPNWDHTPRSGRFGRLFKNCTPEYFAKHVRAILSRIKNKSPENQIIFLKSWNEWGEGNYLEPDLEFGKAFGMALNNELNHA